MLVQDVDWYCPPRSPTTPNFGAPGDRFIPNRSLMNIEIAQSLLRTKNQDAVLPFDDSLPTILTPREEYRRRLEECLLKDSEGKPFKMLVFKGSPRTPKVPLVDEMLQEEKGKAKNARKIRHIPKSFEKILDAPGLLDDFYLNLMDWGQNNFLAAALGTSVYLWNAGTCISQLLAETYENEVYPSSLAWSANGNLLAVGMSNSQILLWDATTFVQVRSLGGHSARVGSLAWNGDLLTSASKDGHIINHDVREEKHCVSCKWEHANEVCGLRWSSTGKQLASGGNDNTVRVWEASHMTSSKCLFQLEDHCAAVKALAWCPHQSSTLATGGGTADGCIRIWNTQTGECSNCVETHAQICALEWNRHQKEILSAHGYNENHLCLWRYPSMSKMGELRGHISRILSLSQSPDGLTVASASADETIGMWKVFGPPSPASLKVKDERDSPLSIDRLHIR